MFSSHYSTVEWIMSSYPQTQNPLISGGFVHFYLEAFQPKLAPVFLKPERSLDLRTIEEEIHDRSKEDQDD